MDFDQIKKILSELKVPDSGYKIFNISDNSYLGKDNSGKLIFLIESNNNNLKSFMQSTKNLIFLFNKTFLFELNGVQVEKTVHMLICNSTNNIDENIFLRLTKAFALNRLDDNQEYLINLFITLKKLFSNESKVGELELQGLYAEIYTMLYFKKHGCDIVDYWQTHGKMKFDFSINDIKRIEIKSTLKSNRIHKFRHEQLLSDIYDIRIVSIMLQKNDKGLSLKSLLNDIYHNYQDRIDVITHISSIVNNIEPEELDNYKYDLSYIENNIGLYNAKDIPHFKQKSPDGVSHAEYDSDLTGINQLDVSEIINWIKNN